MKAASGTKLRVHLHAVERGGELWRNHLLFRDALRRDPLLCGRYQALKLALARQHATDKAAYTEAKAPFIRAVLDQANSPCKNQPFASLR